MTQFKKWIFPILALGMVIPCLLWFTCRDSEPDTVVVVDDWTDTLTVSGYEPAEIVDEPELLDELPESVESVLYASGSAGEHEIEVSVVETPDGSVWLKGTVNGDVIKWRKVQYIHEPEPERDHDWSLLIASELIDGVDLGVGIAYQPLTLFSSQVGLQAVCDLNTDLAEAPDWGSVSARVSRRYGAFSIGGYGGYRFGEQQGLAIGVALGVAVGL